MKLKQMEKACKLREQGFSMEQIANTLNVSKSSVSNWVKDIELSKGALAHIKSRRQLGREHARESRLKNIFRQRTVLYEKCSTEILPLSIRDLWIAGLMLYAGEGRKAWNVSGQPVELTSSEPDILRIFINFLIKVCNIPRNKIKI